MTTAAQHTTKSFYDRISGAYDLLSDSSERTYRERGLTLLKVQPGEHALEIGYGTGHSLIWLAQAVGPTGKVSGVDISDGMFQVATRHAAEAGVTDRIDLHVAPAPPLAWPDATFDLVNLSFTLELFPLDVIPQVLAEIKRVLKPRGRMGTVSMATVAPGDKTSSLEWTYQWSHRHFPHIVDCQPIDAEGLIRAAGFMILASERHLMWTMPVAAVVGGK